MQCHSGHEEPVVEVMCVSGRKHNSTYTIQNISNTIDRSRFLSVSQCSPRVLYRKRRFYSKRLLLGAVASEAASALSCKCAYAYTLVIEPTVP